MMIQFFLDIKSRLNQVILSTVNLQITQCVNHIQSESRKNEAKNDKMKYNLKRFVQWEKHKHEYKV